MKGDFGFRKVKPHYRYHRINKWYTFFVVITFLIFSFVARVQNAVFANPSTSIFDQNLDEMALYLSTYDLRASSVLLSMQRIIKWYDQPEFLETYGGDIQNVLQYLSNNPENFSQLWLQEFKPFINFITKLSAQPDDILSLLGKERAQTYIIALQNTAEKRPNGWFFWSFVKVTLLDAKIKDLQFIDSYVPGIIRPDITLQAPERAKEFLSNGSTITFLASNKFGFTDIDWKNIKKLYDMTYGTDIRGVVFLQSALFSDLLPGFQEKLWEWQFKNAAIDLIRWQALPNKKELYFNGVNEYLSTHKTEIAKRLLQNFQKIIDNRYVQVHLVRTSPQLQDLLDTYQLKTVFSPGHIYSWDYNSSFNKIDSFVHKTTSILDDTNTIVQESTHDVINIAALKSGKYSMNIQYFMAIPDSYLSYIDWLSKELGITLNSREKHILAIYPERSTRGVVYMPENITVQKVNWPVKASSIFNTPFSHNAFYILENTTNNSLKKVSIEFEVK